MGTVLITRPQESSDQLSRQLEAAGYTCLIEPLLSIEPTGALRPPNAVQAVLFTSGNALKYLDRQTVADLLSYPCFCVGGLTANKAKNAGFTKVFSADGDGRDLAALIAANLADTSLPLLHISAQDYDSSAKDALHKNGFKVMHWPIYRAVAAAGFSQLICEHLTRGTIDAVLFFSARTAETFCELAASDHLTDACRTIVAVGLSQNICDVLNRLRWQKLVAAPLPIETAVVACLKHYIPPVIMTNASPPPSPETLKASSTDIVVRRRVRKWKFYSLAWLAAILCGLVAALWVMQLVNSSHMPAVPVAIAPVQTYVAPNPETTPIATYNVTASPQVSSPAVPELKSSSDTSPGDRDDILRRQSQDIARLQSDVVALSAAFAGLQADVKRATEMESRMQKSSQATLATAIDFMRLRDAASVGHIFARELSAFRADLNNLALPDLTAIEDRLNQLEPLAAQAVPSSQQLREQFAALEPGLARSAAKATAQNWWQRAVAEIKGLVIVRRNGGPTDTYAKIENDLAQNDVDMALQDTETLPLDATKLVEPWRARLKMRQQIDETLSFVANHITGRSDILSPSITPPASQAMP